MLTTLTIRDFVIVEHMELTFNSGFTVLTGETGAGKSILIEALALVLGGRAEAMVVRQGALRAEVSAEFDVSGLDRVTRFLEQEALAEEVGVCGVRRLIEAGGRSRGFINGTPVTVTQLRELGELLVHIHGQHQSQALGRTVAQRELIDGYASHQAMVVRVGECFQQWQKSRQLRQKLEGNAAALQAERDRLEWQVNELTPLAMDPAQWLQFNAEHSRLSHAASLIELSAQTMDQLADTELASLPQLNGVISRIKNFADFDPELTALLAELESAQVQLQEAVYSLRHYQQKLELDPQRLRELEERLQSIHLAARKFRVDPDALAQSLAQAQGRLMELTQGGDIEALKEAEAKALELYRSQARKLSLSRTKAAREFSEKVTQAMQELAMSGGRLEVSLLPLDEPAAHGMENIEFLVSAHKALPPQPLAKVASGGELSRISLAIQTIASELAQVPTLLFDEVDAGIGGRVAEIVGQRLKSLAGRFQVMCITHLPQVAACAHQQWQVAKSVSGTALTSRVLVLTHEQRIEELARMLGGVKITQTTRRHAAEMLDSQ